MKTKAEFPVHTYFGVLRHIADEPPSDDMLSTVFRMKIAEFVDRGVDDAVTVWNFYKELLDFFVNSAGAAPFLIALFDLEQHYEAPAGAYAQSDGSINRAPWRQGT